MENCIFCKIIAGEIDLNKVYEDEKILAFKDIAPQAPVHILIVPKEHIASINDITPENAGVISEIFTAIPEIARITGISESGYRIINNCGSDGGQTVFHVHFHLVGGRPLGEGLVC